MDTENQVLKCKLESDKRWAKMEVEIQKVKDDIHSILTDRIPTMEARLNKQAAMVSDIQQLSLNVASLSQNMQSMLEEIKTQNDRLNNLEQKPAKRWENTLDTIIKLIVTAGITFVLVRLGLQ